MAVQETCGLIMSQLNNSSASPSLSCSSLSLYLVLRSWNWLTGFCSGGGAIHACIQDEEWQKRNREAINSIEVGHSARRAQQAVAASQRELAELAAHHRPTGRNDSVLGSWFFIEKFTISNIHSNVTINLSSNIVAQAQLLTVQVRVRVHACIHVQDTAVVDAYSHVGGPGY